MIKSKKGQERSAGTWVIWAAVRLLLIVLILYTLKVFIFRIANLEVETAPQLEQNILSQRFYRHPLCFAADSATGGTDPYTIDASKFSQDTIHYCYNTSDRGPKPAFSVHLESTVKDYGRANTTRWKGTRTDYTQRVPVSILDNGARVEGWMTIESEYR